MIPVAGLITHHPAPERRSVVDRMLRACGAVNGYTLGGKMKKTSTILQGLALTALLLRPRR